MMDLCVEHTPEPQADNPFLTRLRSLPRLADVPRQNTALSLFCGGGGLDLGLSLAGFDIKVATDIESTHCATITQNFPDCLALPLDVRELRIHRLRRLLGMHSFDLIAAGSPCQSFSILGRRGALEDPRGQLIYEFVRLVRALRPRAFLFENVPGLMTVNGGNDWNALQRYIAEETSYALHVQTLNAADYGVPQERVRLLVVGFRAKGIDFDFPKETHRDPAKPLPLEAGHEQLPTWLPARAALEEVDGLPNHRLRPHGPSVMARYTAVPQGGRDEVDHTDRIHPDRPAGTVIVGSKGGGGRPHIHPFEPRHLTVREAARLQSFPDWYEFAGPNTWQYRAVGNAVPPLLAKAVGEQIAVALDKWKRQKPCPLSPQG